MSDRSPQPGMPPPPVRREPEPLQLHPFIPARAPQPQRKATRRQHEQDQGGDLSGVGRERERITGGRADAHGVCDGRLVVDRARPQRDAGHRQQRRGTGEPHHPRPAPRLRTPGREQQEHQRRNRHERQQVRPRQDPHSPLAAGPRPWLGDKRVVRVARCEEHRRQKRPGEGAASRSGCAAGGRRPERRPWRIRSPRRRAGDAEGQRDAAVGFVDAGAARCASTTETSAATGPRQPTATTAHAHRAAHDGPSRSQSETWAGCIVSCTTRAQVDPQPRGPARRAAGTRTTPASAAAS